MTHDHESCGSCGLGAIIFFQSNQTMNICINELCRTTRFDFIDFQNSFVYGTNTTTKQAISIEGDF